MKLAVCVVSIGLCSFVGCSGAAPKAQIQERSPLVVPPGDDPLIALDTETGRICLTYDASADDRTIASLHGLSEKEKRKVLEGMRTEDKERVMKRLTQYKGYPECKKGPRPTPGE